MMDSGADHIPSHDHPSRVHTNDSEHGLHMTNDCQKTDHVVSTDNSSPYINPHDDDADCDDVHDLHHSETIDDAYDDKSSSDCSNDHHPDDESTFDDDNHFYETNMTFPFQTQIHNTHSSPDDSSLNDDNVGASIDDSDHDVVNTPPSLSSLLDADKCRTPLADPLTPVTQIVTEPLDGETEEAEPSEPLPQEDVTDKPLSQEDNPDRPPQEAEPSEPLSQEDNPDTPPQEDVTDEPLSQEDNPHTPPREKNVDNLPHKKVLSKPPQEVKLDKPVQQKDLHKPTQQEEQSKQIQHSQYMTMLSLLNHFLTIHKSTQPTADDPNLDPITHPLSPDDYQKIVPQIEPIILSMSDITKHIYSSALFNTAFQFSLDSSSMSAIAASTDTSKDTAHTGTSGSKVNTCSCDNPPVTDKGVFSMTDGQPFYVIPTTNGYFERRIRHRATILNYFTRTQIYHGRKQYHHPISSSLAGAKPTRGPVATGNIPKKHKRPDWDGLTYLRTLLPLTLSSLLSPTAVNAALQHHPMLDLDQIMRVNNFEIYNKEHEAPASEEEVNGHPNPKKKNFPKKKVDYNSKLSTFLSNTEVLLTYLALNPHLRINLEYAQLKATIQFFIFTTVTSQKISWRLPHHLSTVYILILSLLTTHIEQSKASGLPMDLRYLAQIIDLFDPVNIFCQLIELLSSTWGTNHHVYKTIAGLIATFESTPFLSLIYIHRSLRITYPQLNSLSRNPPQPPMERLSSMFNSMSRYLQSYFDREKCKLTLHLATKSHDTASDMRSLQAADFITSLVTDAVTETVSLTAKLGYIVLCIFDATLTPSIRKPWDFSLKKLHTLTQQYKEADHHHKSTLKKLKLLSTFAFHEDVDATHQLMTSVGIKLEKHYTSPFIVEYLGSLHYSWCKQHTIELEHVILDDTVTNKGSQSQIPDASYQFDNYINLCYSGLNIDSFANLTKKTAFQKPHEYDGHDQNDNDADNNAAAADDDDDDSNNNSDNDGDNAADDDGDGGNKHDAAERDAGDNNHHNSKTTANATTTGSKYAFVKSLLSLHTAYLPQSELLITKQTSALPYKILFPLYSTHRACSRLNPSAIIGLLHAQSQSQSVHFDSQSLFDFLEEFRKTFESMRD